MYKHYPNNKKCVTVYNMLCFKQQQTSLFRKVLSKKNVKKILQKCYKQEHPTKDWCSLTIWAPHIVWISKWQTSLRDKLLFCAGPPHSWPIPSLTLTTRSRRSSATWRNWKTRFITAKKKLQYSPILFLWCKKHLFLLFQDVSLVHSMIPLGMFSQNKFLSLGLGPVLK